MAAMNKSKEKLTVITGAAGFIGSGIVRYLNDRGRTNLLLVDDIEQSEKWKNLIGKKCALFISPRELFSYLEGKEDEIEAFIHLGACSDTLVTDGNYVMENNYRFSVRLAEYALKHNHRFIYASSAATYGDGSRGFSDDHNGLEELKPLNLYGFSKHFFDLWLKAQGLLDKVVGLKYFNVFGPNEDHKDRMASMVYKMLPNAQKEGLVRLFKSSDPSSFGDGDQKRDFIYVKDVASITCDFLENQMHGIFNIGRGEAITWNRLAGALLTAIDRPVKIEYIEMPPALARQYQNYTCADMTKYFKQKGCSPSSVFKTTIEEEVKDYVCNHLLRDERW
jgi:ADP-L-glycero-D-manno-heptose 6-epimerase